VRGKVLENRNFWNGIGEFLEVLELKGPPTEGKRRR